MSKLHYLVNAFVYGDSLKQMTNFSCKKDNPQLGDPPSDADATFSYAPSVANPNIIDFTVYRFTAAGLC